MKKAALTLIIVVLASLTALAQTTTTSVPPLINYQGMLGDANGNPLSGTRKLTFNIYDAASGGNLVWGPQVFESVPLINGRFNVILGTTDTKGKLITEAFGAKDRYLGITVDTNSEIDPRQQILSTPFAIQAANGNPPGTILSFGGNTVPPGYLLCDGSAVSRSTYAALFRAIDTAWGKGNGTTTFHLPDLRGRFLRSVDGGTKRDPNASSRTASNSGGNTGDDVGSVQQDEFYTHNHPISAPDYTIATQVTSSQNKGTYSSGKFKWSSEVIKSIKISSSGGSETRPKNAYVKYIIKY